MGNIPFRCYVRAAVAGVASRVRRRQKECLEPIGSICRRRSANRSGEMLKPHQRLMILLAPAVAIVAFLVAVAFALRPHD